MKTNYFAIKLPDFLDLAKREIYPGKTFYDELMEYGTVYGSNIASNFNCNDKIIEKLKEKLKADKNDLIIICYGGESKKAADSILQRAKYCMKGVSEETRKPNPDGTTSYSRPLPGSARMYPETDCLPIKITKIYFNEIKKSLPKTLPERKIELEKFMSKELANQIIKSKYYSVFEESLKKFNISPVIIATTFTSTIKDLKRNGIKVEKIDNKDFIKIFEAVEKHKISKQSIPDILTKISMNESVEKAIEKFGMIGKQELEKIIKKIIDENKDKDLSVLVGLVMREVKGKADSKTVINELKRMLK